MHSHLVEWVALLLRWTHVITAIAWIGASFYFVWLDNHLVRPSSDELKTKGVDGELWAVHGGGFYNPQKYMVAPAKLPENLHWFYWESYSTWMSGFALLVVVYLSNAEVYLVDPSVRALSSGTAIGLALGYLGLGWAVYDAVCRTLGKYERLVGAAVSAYVTLATYAACQVFSGRGAFLLTGAMMATIMSANVFFWIIPGQRRVVQALRQGQAPDPMDGKRGKQRSVHNTYFTLPVLLAMLSNHYSFLYAHRYNWLVLLGLMGVGVLVREFFLLRHKGVFRWSLLLGAVALIGAVIGLTLPRQGSPTSASSRTTGSAVSLAELKPTLALRCYGCHSANPTLMSAAPKGLLLDHDPTVVANASLIYQQVVLQRIMPLGNLTQITEEERSLFARWFEGLQDHPAH
jgi:uncharacterized membrane protein